MAARPPDWLTIPLAAAPLLWPAAWNGYPLVFADTGTYLSQVVHLHLGWDRPVFYSLAILPLHLTVSLWPIVVAQALLAAWVLMLVCRLLAGSSRAAITVSLGLATATWFPFVVCQVMPDLLTPLLVLTLCLLVLAPHALSRSERFRLVALAAFMIAAQQSSVVLAIAVLLALWPTAHWAGAASSGWRLGALALALAVAALVGANLLAFGRFSVSPFGNVFLLARVVADGPGLDVLRRDCPAAGWRLCPYVAQMPSEADDILWRADSPIVRAGGHKAVAADADAIIAAAVSAAPGQEARAALRNFWQQLTGFASGDGLQAWPTTVTPWIDADFPAAERTRYHAARQQQQALTLPDWLAKLHQAAVLAGIAAAALLIPLCRRRHPMAAPFLAIALLALPASALVTGTLSGPHDRYQSRIAWLPAGVTLAVSIGLRRQA